MHTPAAVLDTMPVPMRDLNQISATVPLGPPTVKAPHATESAASSSERTGSSEEDPGAGLTEAQAPGALKQQASQPKPPPQTRASSWAADKPSFSQNPSLDFWHRRRADTT